MHFPDIPQVALEGLTYDILKYLFQAFLVTSAIQWVLKNAFHLLPHTRETIVFSVGGTIVLFFLFVLGSGAVQRPNLQASIQQVISGPLGDHDTVAVLALNVINTGTMQTIVQNWSVEAKANGQTYRGLFGQMPPTFTFNKLPHISQNQPESMTFYSIDQIIEKSLQPIQVGGLLPGIIFVDFQGIDPSVFRGVVEYTVSFQDVLGRRYSASIQSTGRIDTVGLVPGLKTEMTCPLPPGGLPKLGNELVKSHN